MSKTLILTKDIINKLETYYLKYQIENTTPYQRSCFKSNDFMISVYLSNKVLFQGNKSEQEANRWESNHIKISSNEKSNQKIISNTFPQSGSDEVGTGDYFGPVIVCAAYLDEYTYNKLKDLKIDDSKVIKDEYIMQIGAQLMQLVPNALLILDNPKYNIIHESNNLNQIKAKLHNQAYNILSTKVEKMSTLNVVDQFTPAISYYNYLKGEEHIFNKLTFYTKAESKFTSVAVASMIARYTFLKCMDALSNKYKMEIPKGANKKVDLAIISFVKKYGKEALVNVAKVHFKNTKIVEND